MSLRQCAAALLVNPSGHLLLIQQQYGLRLWGAPGGVVDEGETPQAAAVRETQEEVGLTVEVTGLVGRYLLQGGGWPDVLAHVFLARVVAGTPRPDPAEVAALGWYPPDQLPGPLLPDLEAALQDWQAGQLGAERTVQRRLTLPPLH
ncbi:NUDIX domain-containing protein [Deinococcus sp. HMF7604]|uniref:NUDIX hydrolase n=1 Tax=Deinococcus betulae TaxID=2873312 RepID=UPI001CC9CFE8|nr:NUDIX domain-containing protein [Deinococcus betulae]MBZ9750499.1 NUDIX domain-containing protein [Deinococcus betulae]